MDNCTSGQAGPRTAHLRSSRRKGTLLAIGALVVAASAPAAAQDNTGFEVQRFHPTPSQRMGYITLDSGETLPGGDWEIGLFGHYSDDPFVANRGDDRIFSVIESQVVLDLLLAWAPWNRIQLGVDVPFYLSQSGGEGGAFGGPDTLESAGLGDIRIIPKFTLLQGRPTESDGGFSLALLVPLSLPTGDPERFQGEDFRLEPRLAADFRTEGGFGIGVNIGALIRPTEVQVSNVEVTNQLTYGLGLRIPIVREMFWALAEVNGGLTLGADDVGSEENPLEGLLGVRVRASSFYITGGAGTGFVEGYGTPDFRAFLGISISPREDHCPAGAEDVDGFEDDDNCIDPDNDQDGILDESDDCPNDAEDFDGFQDQDGCPDPDNDNDGLLDGVDACPNDPEDADGFQDEDGCPDPDNDGDGILDVSDDCVNTPEDLDGFEDEDGCPEEGPAIERPMVIEITQQIQFDYDSARIRTESYPILDAVANILRDNADIRMVRVEGHTSTEGAEDHNMDLSQRRARSVVDALVERGIDRSRLTPEGFGESRPLEPDETRPGARERNRRVEFHIVERNQ